MPFDANGKWIPVMEPELVSGKGSAVITAPGKDTPIMDPNLPPKTTTVMPTVPTGAPVMEDDSVSNKLTGLLDSNSKYMTQARAAGTRVAGRRGLLNSSIAAGSSEAAAIAAAAPIASQEASTVAARNQARLEGSIQYDNSSRLQSQQDEAAMGRQLSGQEAQRELQRLDAESAILRQREAQGFELTRQERDNLAAMDRQREQISASDRQALLAAETSILNNRQSSQADMAGNYLQALSSLTNNPKLKAADRDAYIREFQRVTGQSQPLQQTLSNVQLNWPAASGGAPATPAVAPSTSRQIMEAPPKNNPGSATI